MEFHKKLIKQATDVLDPIKMAATWTASITAAAGTRLTQSLFLYRFKVQKSIPIWNALRLKLSRLRAL